MMSCGKFSYFPGVFYGKKGICYYLYVSNVSLSTGLIKAWCHGGHLLFLELLFSKVHIIKKVAELGDSSVVLQRLLCTTNEE